MTELAKTLEGLTETLIQKIAERQKKEPAIPWFVHAREIARTGQLGPAQSGDVEAVARAIKVAVMARDAEPGLWYDHAAQAAIGAMTSAKDAEIAAATIAALQAELAEAREVPGKIVAWLRADLIEEYGEQTAQEQVAWHYATAIEARDWSK